MTYMLPGLIYEGSSSFQSVFQAETEINIGFNTRKHNSSITCVPKHLLQALYCSKSGCSKNNDKIHGRYRMNQVEYRNVLTSTAGHSNDHSQVQTSHFMEREAWSEWLSMRLQRQGWDAPASPSTPPTYLRLNVRNFGPGKLKFT